MAEIFPFSRPVPPLRVIHRPLTLTIFPNQWAKSKDELVLPLTEIAALVTQRLARRKADLPYLKLSLFGDERTDRRCLRTNANLLMIDGIEIDHDDGTMSIEEARDRAVEADIAALFYTTPSHTEEKPHWRGLFPTSMTVDREWREPLCARIQGLLGGAAAPESFTRSQAYHYGAVEGGADVQVEMSDGRGIDEASELDAEALGRDGRPYGSPAEVRPVRAKRVRRDDGDPEFVDDGGLWPEPDWELIESALDAIPPEEREGYVLWNRLVMAIHQTGHGSRQAFEVADRWSQACWIFYDHAELVAKWKSYRNDGETRVDIATIFYEAMRRGWKHPRRKHEPVVAAHELTVEAWLERDLPQMNWLLGELLSTTSRGILIAPTGLGKTNFALALIFDAIEGNGFLHWRGSGKRRRGLYIDGEMPRGLFQERMRDAVRRSGSIPQTLFAFSTEDFPDMPPLNTVEGQRYIDKVIEELGGVDFIVFDNIQALIPGDLRDTEAWQNVLPWARDLTRREIGLLWIHHTGHDKTHGYGDSSREWQFDFVAMMTKVEQPGTDIAFELSFPKARQRKPSNRADFAPVLITLDRDEWRSEAAPLFSSFTPTQRGALAELDSLIATGKNTEEKWREASIAGERVSKGKSYESRKRVFNNARSELLQMKVIVICDDKVWRRDELFDDL